MTRRESPPTEPVYRGSVWSPLKPWGPIEKRKDQQPPVIDPLDTPEMREFINRLGQGIKFPSESPVGTATVDQIPFLSEFRQYQDMTDQFGPSQAPAGPSFEPVPPYIPTPRAPSEGFDQWYNPPDRPDEWFYNPRPKITDEPSAPQPAPALAVRGIPGISNARPIRYLGRIDANTSPASVFDNGARAAQFVLPGRLNSSDRPTDWAATLAGLGPLSPMRAVPAPQAGGASLAPSDSSSPMGGLAGRIAALSGIDPDNPDQPVPPPGGLLALLLAAQR
jgi:hypothetical protein